jgi:hypothetical protein
MSKDLKWYWGKAYTGSQNYLVVTRDNKPIIDLVMPKEMAKRLAKVHNAALKGEGLTADAIKNSNSLEAQLAAKELMKANG